MERRTRDSARSRRSRAGATPLYSCRSRWNRFRTLRKLAPSSDSDLPRLHRGLGRPGRLHVPADLGDELLLPRKGSLVAEPLPELDEQTLTVEVARVVEQKGLDAPLEPAVMRIRADRDSGAVAGCGARVNSVPR